jgi:hypothetical protein
LEGKKGKDENILFENRRKASIFNGEEVFDGLVTRATH